MSCPCVICSGWECFVAVLLPTCCRTVKSFSCCIAANLLPYCQISDAVQYVVEARYTGEEHEVAGATQQQVVGHKERYISALPVNYGNRDSYM